MSGFLKSKGISLKKGSYSGLIQNGCHTLTEAINLSQKGLHRAKSGLNQKLGEMRDFIHRQTAPPGTAAPSAGAGPRPGARPKAPPRQPKAAKDSKKPGQKRRP